MSHVNLLLGAILGLLYPREAAQEVTGVGLAPGEGAHGHVAHEARRGCEPASTTRSGRRAGGSHHARDIVQHVVALRLLLEELHIGVEEVTLRDVDALGAELEDKADSCRV